MDAQPPSSSGTNPPPSSSDRPQQQQPGNRPLFAASSSPLKFPASSSPGAVLGRGASGTADRTTTLRRRAIEANSSSPLKFPSSSPFARRQHGAGPEAAAPAQHRGGSSEPLFFPPSSNEGTPRASRVSRRRGDIHSTAPPGSTPGTVSRRQTRPVNGSVVAASDPISAPSERGLPSQATEGEMVVDDEQESQTVIWGTLVSLQDSMQTFAKFLKGFKRKYRIAYDLNKTVEDVSEYDGADFKVYDEHLRAMRITAQTNLNLDLKNLLCFPATRNLYIQLLNYPQELIPICDQVLKDCVIELAEDDLQVGMEEITESDIADLEACVFKIRPFGYTGQLPRSIAAGGGLTAKRGINMRELNPADIDKIVAIRGLVIRATAVIPDMKLAFFRCLNCGHTQTVEIDRGRIAEPQRCPRDVCGQIGSMSLVHNRCEYADRQVIRLQETPDEVPDGQTPHTVSLCVYDELVDVSKPGDRIEVTGIFRSVPVRVNPRQRVIKSLFKTYLDVVHIKKSDPKRLGIDQSTRGSEGRMGTGVVGVGGEDDEEQGVTEAELAVQDDLLGLSTGRGRGEKEQSRAEMEDELVELSKRSDIYELLARSLAPSIWEMDDVKKGILLQLFGGTNKTIGKGGGAGGPRYRGDINVLLVGDPGTSKSQILQYVHKIAPRGVYTSGKGSSAVGLTAYVTRDTDSRQLVLESGALVLSDGGVCCIDEFDKMSDATRSVLHEVMEQQTVSIAKAGIITTLNARTSLLAAANPVGSKYNLKWPITKNIDLPPTLISRFDLVYLVLDRVDETSDRKLAKHLVGLYLEDRPETGTGLDVLPMETLTSYISYARNKIHPVLTEAASHSLVKAYVAMRKVGEDPRTNERRITATTRQLESMIRLSEAHARMRFSERVEVEDVEEANRLIREALKESATDPTTGLIDLDLLQTGQGLHQRKVRDDFRREVVALLEDRDRANRGMRWSDLLKALEDQSSVAVESSEFADVIKGLESDGQVKVVGERDKRLIRRVIT